MAWNSPPRIRNETHFVGPHRFLHEMQMEVNELGKLAEPWYLHGWELTPQGWVACCCRSISEKMEDS